MVVTIIGILLAIAIPTFLGARKVRTTGPRRRWCATCSSAPAAADIGGHADAAKIQADEPTLHVVGRERRREREPQ